MTSVVIVDIVRTGSGKGKAGGALSGVHPANLLATVFPALIERTGIDPALVDDVIAGRSSRGSDVASATQSGAPVAPQWVGRQVAAR